MCYFRICSMIIALIPDTQQSLLIGTVYEYITNYFLRRFKFYHTLHCITEVALSQPCVKNVLSTLAMLLAPLGSNTAHQLVMVTLLLPSKPAFRYHSPSVDTFSP